MEEDTIGFPGGLAVKNLPVSAGDTGETSSIPGLGRSPGGGNSNPLQYACLENPMDRGAWWATVHGAAKESDAIEHNRAAAESRVVYPNPCNPRE